MPQEVVLLGATIAQPATDYGGQYLPLTHVEQKLKTVNYRWNPNSLAYEVETVTGGGTGTDVNVTNSSIPVTFAGALPAGANTLGKVDQGVGGVSAWKVDGSAVTQPVSGPLTDTQLRASAVPISGALTDTQLRTSAVPVSAATLPLPTGAATLANQTTELASLASIDSKLTAPLATTITKADLVANAPAVAVVGATSATALAANGARKGLVLRNLSTSSQRISLGLDGAAAVLDAGITLYPRDAYAMGEYDFTNGALAAIASAAGATLSLQEYQ